MSKEIISACGGSLRVRPDGADSVPVNFMNLIVILALSCFQLGHLALTNDSADYVPFFCACFLALAGVLLTTVCGRWTVAPSHHQTVLVLFFVQIYLMVLAMCMYPACQETLVIMSTIVFCLFELPNLRSDWAASAVLGRHFFMWYIPVFIREKEPRGWLLGVFAGTTVALAVYLTKKLQRVRAHHCSCTQTQAVLSVAVLSRIAAGVVVVSADGRLRYCNSQARSLLTTTDADVETSLRLLACFPDPESVDSAPLLTKAMQFLDSPSDVQSLGLTKVAERYYQWSASLCQWGESPACAVTATDVSPWVESILKLKRESDSKSELLRFVSHELRTPANAILNLSSNVRSADNLRSEQKLELSMVVTSTYFLLSVVNDLLDFTRIAAAKFTLVKRSFDVRKEVREAVSLVELQCAQKGLTLTVKFDDYVPDTVFSDPTRLKQVLLNLLGNALKFTFHGGIQAICLLTDRNTLKITVKDSGIGIPKEKIAGLCQAFAIVEGTQSINPQGCGLGLYISNFLAISLGSRPIEIQSKVGIGSEFSFEVLIFQQEVPLEPGVKDATTDIEDERDCESTVSTPSFIGGISACSEPMPGILVVDDSDFNRVVLLKMLETLHLHADEATSGLRALTLIRSNQRKGHSYRLILMDIEMPEMDGLAATREIRAMEQAGELSQRTKIVACSAHRASEDAERFKRAGMDECMEKPVSIARLTEIVQTV